MVEPALAFALFSALAMYVVTGGADFGGGAWELVAKTEAEHDAIKRALAPIWEANHVWLILVVVLLFVCFPSAFAAISISLHIPLVLTLIGIVLRGSAFAFRSYSAGDIAVEHTSIRVFAVASLMTPIFLGVCAGTVIGGSIHVVGGQVQTSFMEWLAPFPFMVGALTLAICCWLAAVYMTVETASNPDLEARFRRRALGMTAVVAVATLACLLGAFATGAIGKWVSTTSLFVVGALTLLGLCATTAALTRQRFRLARLTAAASAVTLVAGGGVAQYPLLIPPDIAFSSAAPESVTVPVLIVLGLGSLLLLPALVWLFRIFKGQDMPIGDEH